MGDTPTFEDWLRRLDVPIEYTTSKEKYLEYLHEELGIRGRSLDIAEEIYEEKYDILKQYYPELGIKEVPRRTVKAGLTYYETRYSIRGLRGLFGYRRALQEAYKRALKEGLVYASNWLRAKLEELGWI